MLKYNASQLVKELAKDVRAFLDTHPVDTNPNDAEVPFFKEIYIAAKDFQEALVERIYSDESDWETMSETELTFAKGVRKVSAQILEAFKPIVEMEPKNALDLEDQLKQARKAPSQSCLQELENLVTDYFTHQK